MTRGLALLPLTAVLLAGCGGGGGGAAGGGLSKADYVGRAGAICKDAAAKRDATALPTDLTGLSPYVSTLVGIVRDASTRLSALEPPKADAAQLRAKFTEPLAAQVKVGEDYAARVQAAGKDSAKLQQLLAQRPGKGAIDTQFLTAYGLDSCVKAASGG